MNQTEWCKAKGISLATFKYRLRQVRNHKVGSKFLELQARTPKGLKIQWNNLSLELDVDFDEKVLERFLCTISRIS